MNTNNTNQVSLRRVSLLASVIPMLAIFLTAAWAQKAPSIIEQPASQTNLAGDNATLSAAVSGAGPFTYQWRFNGTNLPTLITTVAGDGVGDDNPATNAMLGPNGVAVDAAGNLFIADSYNNRIRKVDRNGIITTVAGNGSSGYPGDGGAATDASLYGPSGVAVDGSGNLFIADSGHSRIRKVDVHGTITTVAGNWLSDYSGDGGNAAGASLQGPTGVAVDAAGNLFIADSGNNRVRQVGTNGVITTVVGKGSRALNVPSGVAVDAAGNLYIALNSRSKILTTSGF
jgi:DNA-binding beta-propeller fold protein YncE